MSAVFAWMRWGKLYALLGLDQSWWLHCLSRFVAGELPYRDFLWHYPPLSLVLLGYPLRWFGVSFTTVQIIVDLWSFAIVFLLYLIFRRFLSPLLNFLAGVLVIAVCATTQSYFSLFCIPNYSHALLTATIGVLILLLGCLRYMEGDGKLTLPTSTLMASGAFIALLSKQEPVLAVAGLLGATVILDERRGESDGLIRRRFQRAGALAALCVLPSLAAYLVLARLVGFSNLLASLRGYDVASGSCPWWPTGLGLLGAGAALGTALCVVAVSSLSDLHAWRRALRGRYYALWLSALLGFVLYAGYEFYLYGEIVLGPETWARKLSRLAPELLSSSSFLRPVLWAALPYWLYLLALGLRRNSCLGREHARTLLLLTPAVLMSTRSLFGTILSSVPEVPAISYPFLLMLAPCLLLRALQWPQRSDGIELSKRSRRGAYVVAGVLMAYSAVRVTGAYAGTLSDRHYTPLRTPAGLVKIKDGRVDAEIYEYVSRWTAPGDVIMEIPLGGGISFALSRPSPTFSTLFTQVRTTPEVQERDLEALRRRPPVVIVAAARPHYGAAYGIAGDVGCQFPNLRWMPGRVRAEQATIPVIDYVERNYRVDRTIGPWVVLRPRFPQP